MSFVRTAYGPGRIVAEDNIGRGNRQYQVEGNGFSIWIDASKAEIIADAGDHVGEGNSVHLPYNPEPQHDYTVTDNSSTIQPDAAGDVQERKDFALDRTHPADSRTHNEVQYSEAGPLPGPDPDMFAPGGPDFRHEYPAEARSASLFTRPAGLDPKFAFPSAPINLNDPVFQFRTDPLAFMNRTAQTANLDPQVGEYQLLIEADKQLREAAWKDVRAKALRLRREGRVKVKDVAPDRIYASVDGDHGTYDVMIVKGSEYAPSFGGGGSQSISNWRCACKWGEWAYKRQMRFVGRLCSHGLATYHEMQSQHLAKRDDPARRGNPYRMVANNLGDYQHPRKVEHQGPLDTSDYEVIERIEDDGRPDLKHVAERLRMQPIGFEPEFNEIEHGDAFKTVDLESESYTAVGKDITAFLRHAAPEDDLTNPFGPGGPMGQWTPAGGPAPVTGLGTPPTEVPTLGGGGATLPKATTTPTGGGGGRTLDAPGGESDDRLDGMSQGAGAADVGQANTIDTYTVKPGDTLSGIAEQSGMGSDWQSLYDANQDTVGGDPNLIQPGQQLDISGGAGGDTGGWGGGSSSAGGSWLGDSGGSSAASGLSGAGGVGGGINTGGGVDRGMSQGTGGSDSAAGGGWFDTGTSSATSGGGIGNNISVPADDTTSRGKTGARETYVRWLLAAPEDEHAGTGAPPGPAAQPTQSAAAPDQAAEDEALNAGSGYGSGATSLGGDSGFGSAAGGDMGFGGFMDMAQPFIDAGAGALGDIGSSVAQGLGGALSSGLSNIVGAKGDGYPEFQHHEPFNGRGGPSSYEDFGSSEDYVNENEKKHREDVDDLTGDIIHYTKGRDKVSSVDGTDDDSDIVRQFQAQNGWLMGGGGGGNAQTAGDAEIADRAAAFLRTAGRKFTLAEQDELINESHPEGARNLASLNLEGTHYLSE